MKLGDKCKQCNMVATEQVDHYAHTNEAIDPCLGRLPGVQFACCGHGDPLEDPYIMFTNGVGFHFSTPMEITAYRDWQPGDLFLEENIEREVDILTVGGMINRDYEIDENAFEDSLDEGSLTS